MKRKLYEQEKLNCCDLQVVVLLGGLGSRLKDFTRECPKPLIQVQGTPFFEYQLRLLLSQGFKRFVFCVGYRADMIENYFGDGSNYGKDISIQYSYDGLILMGTAGALVKALPLLEDNFLLLYGDSFMDIDYFEVLYRYFTGLQNGKKALMTILENANRFDTSNVEMKNGEILLYSKMKKTEQMNYIDYGVGVYHREIFDRLPRDKKIDLADIQSNLVKEQRMAICEVTKRFYEIGTPTSLAEFTEYARRRFVERHPAIFLDRDGVLNEIVYNEETEQLDSPMQKEDLTYIDGTEAALKKLQEKGYWIFLVTNQPAAAKGKTALFTLYDINIQLLKHYLQYEVEFDDVMLCPHHPKGTERTKEHFLVQCCECRKPKAGMLEQIKQKYCLDLDNSYMIGDSYTDVVAGKEAGVKTVFIGNYKCDICSKLEHNRPNYICKDLVHAVAAIFANNSIQEMKED